MSLIILDCLSYIIFYGFKSLKIRKSLPVHYFSIVQVWNCRNDLIKYLAGLLLLEELDLFDWIIKLGSLAKLGNNIKVIIIFKKLVHLYDIGMILNKFKCTHYFRMSNSFTNIVQMLGFFFRSILLMALMLPVWIAFALYTWAYVPLPTRSRS